jgi:hypothetical protein
MKHSKIAIVMLLTAATVSSSFAAPAPAAGNKPSWHMGMVTEEVAKVGAQRGLVMNELTTLPVRGYGCGELLQLMIKNHGKNKLRYTLDSDAAVRGMYYNEEKIGDRLNQMYIGKRFLDTSFERHKDYVKVHTFKRGETVCVFSVHDALEDVDK